MRVLIAAAGALTLAGCQTYEPAAAPEQVTIRVPPYRPQASERTATSVVYVPGPAPAPVMMPMMMPPGVPNFTQPTVRLQTQCFQNGPYLNCF